MFEVSNFQKLNKVKGWANPPHKLTKTKHYEVFIDRP